MYLIPSVGVAASSGVRACVGVGKVKREMEYRKN